MSRWSRYFSPKMKASCDTSLANSEEEKSPCDEETELFLRPDDLCPHEKLDADGACQECGMDMI